MLQIKYIAQNIRSIIAFNETITMKFVHHEIRINKQKATLVISNGVFYDMKH